MLVVQLHHRGGARPQCRMEQQVPSFFTIHLLSSRCSCRTCRDVREARNTLRHAARGQRHPWNRQEIMTIHRAVLLPSSNSAKFSHRDGWHYRSYSLFSVSRMGCQTHAANKINTDRSSLDFLVASIHMNGQIRRRRPVFFFLAPCHVALLSTQFACLLVPTSSSPAFTPTLLRRLGEGGGSHQWFRQLHSRAQCTHFEKRVTIAQFVFAVVFRHSA